MVADVGVNVVVAAITLVLTLAYTRKWGKRGEVPAEVREAAVIAKESTSIDPFAVADRIESAYKTAYDTAFAEARRLYLPNLAENAADLAVPPGVPTYTAADMVAEPPWAGWGAGAEAMDWTDDAIKTVEEGPRVAIVDHLPDFAGEKMTFDDDTTTTTTSTRSNDG